MTKTVEDNQTAIVEAKQHLVKRVKGSLDYKMERITNHLQELHARLNDNYLQYFAECGLSIYSSEYELKALKRVRELIEDEQYEEVTGVIDRWVKRWKRRVSLTPSGIRD